MGFLSQYINSKFSIIFLLTFTNGLSFAMLIPVLPIIIRWYDLPEYYLGLLLGTYSLFQFISTPILWKLSDKYGRKSILLLTQWWTLLSWLILGSAYLIPEKEIFWIVLIPILVIFFSRSIDGITGWNASVAQAVLADKTNEKSRSDIFWKNSAVMWFAIIVWPALWSLSMSSNFDFLGTALLGATISTITLCIIYLWLKETLLPEQRDSKLHISWKKINIVTQYFKWKDEWVVKYASSLRILLFIAFISWTSISTLYLLDTFWFTKNNIWYYLAFTWTFIIFHQSISVKRIVKIFWDRQWLLVWLSFMSLWYLSMALSWENIYLYTIANFFTVMWIATCFSTNSWLFSKSVDSNHQWEILWFSSSIKSFVSIWVPTVSTLIYSYINFSIYYWIAVVPLIAVLIWKFYFWKPRYA